MSKTALRTRLWGSTGKVGRPPRKNFYGILNNTGSKEGKQRKGIEGNMFKKITNQNIK